MIITTVGGGGLSYEVLAVMHKLFSSLIEVRFSFELLLWFCFQYIDSSSP